MIVFFDRIVRRLYPCWLHYKDAADNLPVRNHKRCLEQVGNKAFAFRSTTGLSQEKFAKIARLGQGGTLAQVETGRHFPAFETAIGILSASYEPVDHLKEFLDPQIPLSNEKAASFLLVISDWRKNEVNFKMLSPDDQKRYLQDVVGNRVLALRTALGQTQLELAEESELNFKTLHKIEIGHGLAEFSTYLAILKGVGEPIENLKELFLPAESLSNRRAASFLALIGVWKETKCWLKTVSFRTEKHYLDTVGSHLKSLREKARLSQEQLAARAKYSSNGLISNIENGKWFADFETYARILEALGKPVNYMTYLLKQMNKAA